MIRHADSSPGGSLIKEKMTVEDWKIGINYLNKKRFNFRFNLSKGFYHIAILESTRHI